MIIDLIQTRTFGGADFVFSTINNQDIYTAQIRLNIGSPCISLMQNNESVLLLSSDNINHVKEVFKRESTLFEIKKADGVTCGKISSKEVRGFWSGYKYNQITFNSEIYNCYEVGMGKEGTFVCIYSGEQQIAMIEKPNVVYDNKDFYRIYIEDNKYVEIVCLFATYYDHATAGNYNQVAIKSKKANYYYTINKELKSKYNPQFKELCK